MTSSGKSRLEVLEPAVERVVLRVTDLRIVEDVVAVFVMADEGAQLLDLARRLVRLGGLGRGHHAEYKRGRLLESDQLH